MILPRLLAILIIGGGYLIWRLIFKKWPLRKKQPDESERAPESVFMWMVGFAIIIGQLIYIWVIFSKAFYVSDSISFIFIFFKIIITCFIMLLLYKNIRG